jgi:hypothetical protein
MRALRAGDAEFLERQPGVELEDVRGRTIAYFRMRIAA